MQIYIQKDYLNFLIENICYLMSNYFDCLNLTLIFTYLDQLNNTSPAFINFLHRSLKNNQYSKEENSNSNSIYFVF